MSKSRARSRRFVVARCNSAFYHPTAARRTLLLLLLVMRILHIRTSASAGLSCTCSCSRGCGSSLLLLRLAFSQQALANVMVCAEKIRKSSAFAFAAFVARLPAQQHAAKQA